MNVFNSSKTSKIFLTISPLLLNLILRNKIVSGINLKKYNGIYLITNNDFIPIENNLKDIKDVSFISYHIISLAYRFKRLRVNKSFAKYYTLPFSENIDLSLRYIISAIELVINKYQLREQNIEIYLNKFHDKYINIFLERYYMKRYNIKLKFVVWGKIIIPNKQIHYSYISFKPISLFSIFKLIPLKTINTSEKFVKTNVIEISSFKSVKKPYNINKKDSFLEDKIVSLDFNDLFKYGLNKYKSFLFFLFKLFNNFYKLKFNDIYKIIKYNLIIDYIQLNINRLFMYNVSIFLKRHNFKYLLCSHRSFTYEWLLYKTCRLSNVISIAADFSLGYPLKNIYKKDLSLTTRPDILLVNSLFRKEQYLIANKDYINSGNKFEIINCNCTQVEYARSKSRNIYNINKSDDNFVISIFDNNYGENLAIRPKYTNELGECLYKYKEYISCLVHSKTKLFNLEDTLSKNVIDFCKGAKGDFSLDVNADLIISIGFQGAAIKSAFAFNKPIIFFSSDNNYFDKVIFFDDKILNQELMTNFNKLIYKITELELLLSNKTNIDKKLNQILKVSNKFLELIGITDQTINITSYLNGL